MLKNLISLQIKILIINFEYKDQIEAPGGEKRIIQHNPKMEDSVSL